MISNAASAQTVPATRTLRTVAVVSTQPLQRALENALRSGGYALVLLGSMAHAYSQIKRMLPDLIIVCLTSTDVEGCQLLSMLRLDDDTGKVPIVTHITAHAEAADEDDSPDDQVFTQFASSSVH